MHKFTVTHPARSRFDFCNGVPLNVPTEALTPCCQLRLRHAAMIAEVTHLLPYDVEPCLQAMLD